MKTPAPERFWARVDKGAGSDGCWLWLGYVNFQGYGYFRHDQPGEPRIFFAHRMAWWLTYGWLPQPGDDLDHLCRVRHCVNPLHMEAVPHRTNIKRGVQGTRTACIHGHPFDGARLDIHDPDLREGGPGAHAGHGGGLMAFTVELRCSGCGGRFRVGVVIGCTCEGGHGVIQPVPDHACPARDPDEIRSVRAERLTDRLRREGVRAP